MPHYENGCYRMRMKGGHNKLIITTHYKDAILLLWCYSIKYSRNVCEAFTHIVKI